MKINKHNKPNHNISFSLARVIPNLFTIASLILGVLSIVFAVDENIEKSIYAILIACFFDVIDGRIARMLEATSKFGGELDSLADFVSFGVAPALIIYFSDLSLDYPLGIIIICIYIIAAMLRLARFNVEFNKRPFYENFFVGIPVPVAATLSFVPFYLSSQYNITVDNTSYVIYILVISVLMVSTVPTLSTKKIKIKPIFIPIVLILLSLLFLLLIYYTWCSLLVISVIYILSIPVTFVLFLRNKKKNRKL